MLVLTRKQNEKIQIGDSITITVVRTKGKTVRLGIDAPAHLSVLRGELVFEDEGDAATTDTEIEEPALVEAAAEDPGAARKRPVASVRQHNWVADAPVVERSPAGESSPAAKSGAPLRSHLRARR